METLTQRLHDTADHRFDDPFDPAEVIRAGRDRVRRRRAVAGGAGLAALAVIGSLPLAVAGGGGDHGAAPAAPPRGERLTLGDAVPAVEGRDYTVESTWRSSDTERSGGPFVRGVTPDGTTVLQRYPGGMADLDDAGEVGLAAPGGATRWLADTPDGLGNYAGTAAGDLLFENAGEGGTGVVEGFWVYEADTRRWRAWSGGSGLVTFDVSGGPVAAGTDEVLTTAGPVFDEPRTQLFRTSTRPGSTLTPFADAGNVAQRGTTFAYTDTLARPNTEVTVGDLGGGPPVTFDPHTGDCRQIGIALAADAVVVSTNCAVGDDPDVMTDVVDHVSVFRLDGTPLVSFTGDAMAAQASDRWLTMRSRSRGETGTYVYSFDDGRFLRLADELSAYSGDGAGAGDRVVWERPVDGENGVQFTVARMR